MLTNRLVDRNGRKGRIHFWRHCAEDVKGLGIIKKLKSSACHVEMVAGSF